MTSLMGLGTIFGRTRASVKIVVQAGTAAQAGATVQAGTAKPHLGLVLLGGGLIEGAIDPAPTETVLERSAPPRWLGGRRRLDQSRRRYPALRA
ncbi:hypothetical protein E3O19_15480 [Cryobacterium algoritolerans]|uniref:Uncharacterized protein n=1 Tax=Cryobacterium algoritolerans TaxID=1259184 RepID=A0A4R8WI53_9MICO|nr:hypothetical protein [Cryobacterium algoritolerans]TFC10401.1 hypothetical protein E3O19_15480 [Cryobacterium algoritolerans]